MKIMTYYDYESDRYNYKELCEKALAFDATQDDINALGEWFDRYGMDDWNGECFHVDAYHDLYPIHKEVGYDDYEVVGYTFSSRDEDRFIMRDMTDEEREAEEAEIQKESEECAAEEKRREAFFMKMPVKELVEKYSIGFKRFHSPNESSIGIGKFRQAQEEGAERYIWRRRKSIKKYLHSLKEQEEE